MNKAALLLGLALAAAPAAAAVSTDTVSTSVTVSSSVFMQTGVAIDTRNNVHLVFVDTATLTLKYAQLANGTTTWALSSVSAAQVGPQCALALENGLLPHVVYYQTSGTPGVMHGRLSGGSWSTDTVEAFTGTNTFVSIAVGADRNPRVAYYNSVSSATVFGARSAGVWSTFTVLTSTFGGPVDIALTSTDSARIALVNGSTVTSYRELSYARQTGASTFAITTPYVIGTDTTTLGGLALALDSLGRAHLAVYDTFSDGLDYIEFDTAGSTVAAVVVDSGSGTGFFCDIAVDSADDPRIVYYSTAGLKTATAGGSWAPTVLDSGTVVGVGASVVFNRFDHYLAGYLNADLSEAKFVTDAIRGLSLSGTVLDFSFAPIPGVTLSLAGNIASTGVSISTATGAYSADHLFEGTYSLTPSLTGYSFQPNARSYSVLQSSQSLQNFKGGPVAVSAVGNLFDPSAGESATLNFSVLPGHVFAGVYTLQGRPVKTLLDEDKSAGNYSVVWDGRASDGDIVASGIYLVRFETDNLKQILKMAVVK
ncbi:MAG TPA: hypothetical protein PKX64_07405 [Elusimicrobiota bacterium]|nr:hypothetical protein [Elusimicrobiota bacterium]